MKTPARIALLAVLVLAAACADGGLPTSATDALAVPNSTPATSPDVSTNSEERGPVIGAGGH